MVIVPYGTPGEQTFCVIVHIRRTHSMKNSGKTDHRNFLNKIAETRQIRHSQTSRFKTVLKF